MAQAAAQGVMLPIQTRERASRTRCLVTCAAPADVEQQQVARRSLLAGLALLNAAATNGPAMASAIQWDGVSSSIGSCELGEAGYECRQKILATDSANFESYESAVGGQPGAQVAGNVPVGDAGSKYSRDTLVLMDKVLAFAAMNSNPASPERIQLAKELKGEFPAWVSKYARGGSARTVSAHKVYIVVDAISAHFAANGFAPVPKAKLQKLVADVQAGRELIVAGR